MLVSAFYHKVLRVLCVTLSILIGTVTVDAATYYVATTGNDSNPGTANQPFRTIVRGVKVLRAGDRLYIRSGTYGEHIDSNALTIPTGTSWSDAPIISGYPGERVILAPGSAQIINLPHAYIQYVSFENLVLDGQNTSNETISVG